MRSRNRITLRNIAVSLELKGSIAVWNGDKEENNWIIDDSQILPPLHFTHNYWA